MSPDQGPEALLEGLKRDSDYQTVSKLDKLIVESSGSTRRIQRAQEHQIPTSLSQKIVRRTVHDQGGPKLEGIKRETEDRSCPLAPPRPPPKFAGPPPKGPTIRRTTT
ncbi:hypothetical protein M5K25_014662 [Dendrobium thyrsiflorum]|uniref:Uncharacterized protein n=1 Tax=Dendrobium thyrsiflorum TaxID=117978 RepID=A0ABD0UVY7_DENTH